MAEQRDQTSDNGLPHDDSHVKDWSMECSTEDEDTTKIRLLQKYDTHCTIPWLQKLLRASNVRSMH